MEQLGLLDGTHEGDKVRKPRHNQVVFKKYQQDQLQLLPPSLDELIPKRHIVRLVNQAIDLIDIEPIISSYKGGGTSSYHPKMLLKLIIYGYTQRTFTCRTIAKAARENIYFMWLAGNNQPDFRTINRFMQAMYKQIDSIFTSIVGILIEAGYVKFENYFIDGTKIEANANKYSFVFAKNTKRYKKQVQEKAYSILKEASEANSCENGAYGDKDLEELGEDSELTAEVLEQRIKELEEQLKTESKNKPLKKRYKVLKGDCLPRLAKYEEQEKILGGRNSYSKTDNDAVFMRMKEDHMKNGQLKPAFNVQVASEGEFIVNFSVHQKPGDTTCLIPHLERCCELHGKLPKNVVADAGYGSEENYVFLEAKDVNAYIKYNTFHQEQKKSFKKAKFKVENWEYDADLDEYICPAGKRLKYVGTRHPKTETKYRTERRIYQGSDCDGCPFRDQCTKGKGNRTIQVSGQLNRLRSKASERLTSDQGVQLRKDRAVFSEGNFSHIKYHWGFKRFTVRGLLKVNGQWGLLCIAHNLSKLSRILLGDMDLYLTA